MSDDEWVNMALKDNLFVVDLLLRLKRPNKLSPVLHIDWTVRQPRSKPVLKKSDHSTRDSPTTPLMWSGATSVSGGALPPEDSRSKIAGKNEVTTMKRPRKKKTLAELKEEESLLLNERRSLKDALATLRLTVEEQRAINGNLKKMKLDLQTQQIIELAATSAVLKEANSDQPQPQIVRSICDTKPIGVAAFGCNDIDVSYQFPLPNISCKLQEIGTLGTVRLLPDLNMPFQEDPGSEILYGMS